MTEDTICWHDTYADRQRCFDARPHDRAQLLWYGRCRSGRRWFWAAQRIDHWHDDYEKIHGWQDTEDAALAAARAAVRQLASGQPAHADLRQSVASSTLKEINTARRKARPPSGGTSAGAVEYLYAAHISWPEASYDRERREVIRFRITRKTAKRIYYIRREYGGEDPVTGYVDRQALERDGEVQNLGVHWCRDDSHLYATRELAEAQLYASRASEADGKDVRQLRREMADAHPDRGGTAEQFMAARQRYQRALRHDLVTAP